jgi:hypothetical protein
MSSRTKYLTYIEETRKHHSVIEKVAKSSTKKAIAASHKQFVSVVFMEGERIIKVDAKGEKFVIGEIKNNRRKVEVGAKTQLPKK